MLRTTASRPGLLPGAASLPVSQRFQQSETGSEHKMWLSMISTPIGALVSNQVLVIDLEAGIAQGAQDEVPGVDT